MCGILHRPSSHHIGYSTDFKHPCLRINTGFISTSGRTDRTEGVSKQEVLLRIELTKNQELHDYSIVIRNEDHYYTKTLVEGHTHDRTFVVETNFILPESHNQTYTLTVKATDHNENLASQQVTLYVP